MTAHSSILGESNGQRSTVSYSLRGCKESNMTENAYKQDLPFLVTTVIQEPTQSHLMKTKDTATTQEIPKDTEAQCK